MSIFTKLMCAGIGVTLTLAATTHATAAFVDGKLCYEPLDERSCAVVAPTMGITYSGDVVIPEKAYDSSTDQYYNVVMISNFAFEECAEMTSITFPETLTTIQGNTFNYCTGLKSVTLPASLKNFGHMVFAYSINIEEINVAEGNKYFKSIDGVLYDIAGETVLQAPEKLTEIVVPEGVKKIGYAGFFNCTELDQVVLPEGLEELENGSFMQCESLTSINIPSTVKTIGPWAFDHCLSLEEFVSGENVELINSAAFQGCANLKKFVAGDNLKTLGEGCFMGCFLLEYAYLGKSIETIGDSTFETCTELTELFVPTEKVPEVDVDTFCEENFKYTSLYLLDDSMQLFADDDIWSKFLNMKVYQDGVEDVLATATNLEINTCGATLTATAAGEIRLYDIDGRLIAKSNDYLKATPGNGLFIVKSGADVRKIRL